MKRGMVYLVGAGPGDPGLLTLKGKRVLEQADVVLYDRLVDDRLMRHVPPEAEVVDIGKWPGNRSPTQAEINRVLIDRAQEGKTVVRLKGGDPFVFGRGGEEALALAEAGVPFQVVPGVTSATAVPAYAGIPLTHRQLASSFTVVSGSEDPSTEESLIDWKSLATGPGTLVVLMGWESLPGIVETLLREGMAPDTQAALIRWGTEPYQRSVEGTLDEIVRLGRKAGLDPPVVAVFGKVVGLRQRIGWYEDRILLGKRVLVTRSHHQASALSDLLAQEGAEPIEVPTIQVEPLEDEGPLSEVASGLSRYQRVVFTSVNGVKAFWSALERQGLDARAFGGIGVAVIGPETARSLARRGIRADLVPSEYVSEALVEGLRGYVQPGDRVLLPSAEEARSVLAEGLRALGASVDEVAAYRTTVPQESAERVRTLLGDNKIDVVTLTSSSTARNLVSLLQREVGLLARPAIACIGPITAATARELGLIVGIEAQEHTVPGLVEAIKEHFAG